jgi:Holliday junction resolvase
MAKGPESKIKDQIKRWLTREGYYFFSAAAGPFSVHGVPDIIVCAKGRFVGIEVKNVGKENNTTPNQKAHLRSIAEAGGVALIASSVDTVVEAFEQLDL